MSRPSRARGLKQIEGWMEPQYEAVAPLAGAWIETRPAFSGGNPACVAPLAGAWIETVKKTLL